MSDAEIKLCPACGTPMKQAKFDSTFKFNGKVRMDGWYCPKCAAEDSDSAKPESTED